MSFPCFVLLFHILLSLIPSLFSPILFCFLALFNFLAFFPCFFPCHPWYILIKVRDTKSKDIQSNENFLPGYLLCLLPGYVAHWRCKIIRDSFSRLKESFKQIKNNIAPVCPLSAWNKTFQSSTKMFGEITSWTWWPTHFQRVLLVLVTYWSNWSQMYKPYATDKTNFHFM